jgi:hypothetical protein
MFYLYNKNLSEMMDLSRFLFYFGNVLNLSNPFESSILIIYHMVTTKY